VPQDLGRHVGDVLRYEEAPTAHQGERASGREETERRPRTRAQSDVPGDLGNAPTDRVTCRHHETDRIVLHRVMDEDVVDCDLELDELFDRQHLRGLGGPDPHPARDLELFHIRWLADVDLHQESVPLCLGERVDTFGLDRVLGGEHEERRRCRPRLSRDGHVPFGHDLEQRRLHLRRRAVDLVRKDHVGEHRSPFDVEVLARRAPDARAHDVRRDEIGRELQPYE